MDHILHAAEPHYAYQNLENVLEEMFLLLLCKLLIISREFSNCSLLKIFSPNMVL